MTSPSRKATIFDIAKLAKAPIQTVFIDTDTESVLVIIGDLTRLSFLFVIRLTQFQIIDDLLDLSIIESQEMPERDLVPLTLIVDQSVERSRPGAEALGIKLVSSPISATLAARCDRRQVVMAITNLIDNAMKYSERGSTVEINTSTTSNLVEIAVCDEGIGIPSRDLERIFERFYRVDRARSRATGGTGLGLSIVRHIAQAHGGEVAVESTEGIGSKFRFRIPIESAGAMRMFEEASTNLGDLHG